MAQTLMVLIAAALFVAALKMYMDHRKPDYVGDYRPNGGYENISSTKHDILKIGFVTLFPLLIYGVPEGQKFFDMSNVSNSFVGRTGVLIAGFFIFYELLQPYANKITYF